MRPRVLFYEKNTYHRKYTKTEPIQNYIQCRKIKVLLGNASTYVSIAYCVRTRIPVFECIV